MFTDYRPSHGYDEYFSGADQPRTALRPLLSSLGRMGIEQLNHNHAPRAPCSSGSAPPSGSMIPAARGGADPALRSPAPPDRGP